MTNNEMFEIECSDEESYYEPGIVYRQVNGKRVWEPKGEIIAELYNRIESNAGTLPNEDFDWQNPGKISPSQLLEDNHKSGEGGEEKAGQDSEKIKEKETKTEFDFDNDFDDDSVPDTNAKVTVKNRTSQGEFHTEFSILPTFYFFFFTLS